MFETSTIFRPARAGHYLVHFLDWCVTWCHTCNSILLMKRNCFWGSFSHSAIPLRSRHIAPAKISQLLGFGDLVRSSRRGASAARGGTHSCSLMQVASRSRLLPLSHFVMFIFQGFPYSYFCNIWYILQLLLQGTRNQLLKNGLSFLAGFMFSSTPYGGPKGLGARGIYILRTTWWTMSLPPPEQRKEPTPSGFNGSVPYILPCATGKRWKRERPAVGGWVFATPSRGKVSYWWAFYPGTNGETIRSWLCTCWLLCYLWSRWSFGSQDFGFGTGRRYCLRLAVKFALRFCFPADPVSLKDLPPLIKDHLADRARLAGFVEYLALCNSLTLLKAQAEPREGDAPRDVDTMDTVDTVDLNRIPSETHSSTCRCSCLGIAVPALHWLCEPVSSMSPALADLAIFFRERSIASLSWPRCYHCDFVSFLVHVACCLPGWARISFFPWDYRLQMHWIPCAEFPCRSYQFIPIPSTVWILMT